MNLYLYPAKDELEALLKRPVRDASELNATVATVLQDVKQRGDDAVREYEERFDKVQLDDLVVAEDEMLEAEKLVSEELKAAIRLAHQNIERFHVAQRFEGEHIKVTEGVECWQKSVAIERVGLYIPGGTAPFLYSFYFMIVSNDKLIIRNDSGPAYRATPRANSTSSRR